MRSTRQTRQAASIRARRPGIRCRRGSRGTNLLFPRIGPPRRENFTGFTSSASVSRVSALSQFLPMKISRGTTSPKNSVIYRVTRVLYIKKVELVKRGEISLAEKYREAITVY